MILSNKKISVRQAIILFTMTTLSPAIRIFPQYAAEKAGKAGWLAPIPGIIPIIILLFLLISFFKKNKDLGLLDIYFDILGKIAGRIVISLYLIWTLVLLSLYVRYYSERILASMMPNMSNPFLIIVMLCLVFIAAKSGLETVARSNEIFFILFMISLVTLFVCSIPLIRYKNIMKVSYLDTWSIAKSSLNIISVWGYLLLIFFLGDKIDHKEQLKRFGFQGLAVIFVSCFMILIMTIGALGSMITSNAPLPFFKVIRNISIFGTIEHIEAVALALWIMSDFLIITVFTLIAAAFMKSIFNLSETKSIISPIVLFAGIGAMFLFKNRLELEDFSEFIAIPVNISLLVVIPIIIFIIGKIRKKI